MVNISDRILDYYSKQQVKDKKEEEKEEKESKLLTKEELVEKLKNYNNKIGEIKSEYTVSYETLPTVERVSDDVLKETATNEVDKKYKPQKDKIEEKYNYNKSVVDTTNDNIKDKGEVKKSAISNKYLEQENKASSDAIKKGVQRSSIVLEQIKDLSSQKIQDLLNVDKDVASKLFENNQKIVKIEEDYKEAINKLQTSKAVEIQEKLTTLKKEQDAIINEVEEHNKKIKEKEKLENDRLQKEFEISGENRVSDIERQKLSYGLEYFFSIPKEKALEELESDEIKNVLGENNVGIIRKYLTQL